MLPRAMLRATYENLFDNARSIGRMMKTAHGTISAVRGAIGDIFISGQRNGLQSLTTTKHDVVVYNLLGDSTQLDLLVGNDGVAGKHDVFSQHALVSIVEDGEERQEEVCCPPVAMPDTTAEAMLGAVNLHHHNLAAVLASGTLSCLVLTLDACRANIRLANHMLNLLNPTQFGLLVRCLQHQAGLVLQAVTKYCDIICPLFCFCKQMQKPEFVRRICVEIHRIIERDLDWVQGEDPNPDVISERKLFLERTYYNVDMSTDATLCTIVRDRLLQEGRVRRSEGAELCHCVTGSLRDCKRIVHHCRCCATREDAVNRVSAAITAPLRRRVTSPALNKWLTLWPVASLVLMLLCFTPVFRSAYRVASRLPAEDSSGESDKENANAQLGQPNDERKAHVKLERKRARKACVWIVDPNTRRLLSVWLGVAGQIMRLHYSLFSSAKSLGRMEISPVLNLCNFRISLAVKLIVRLSAGLDPTNGLHAEPWSTLSLVFGPVVAWDDELLTLTWVCVLLCVGGTWRRFVRRFQFYPWRLALLATPGVSALEKADIAREFLALSLCCLDMHFSRKLRALVVAWNLTASDLTQGPINDFMCTVFSNVIVVTTHIENTFAHMRRFLGRAYRVLHIVQLAALHVALESRRVYDFVAEHLQGGRERVGRACEARCRPVWAQTKRKRLGVPVRSTSWSCYLSDVGECDQSGQFTDRDRIGEDFAALSPEMKQSYKTMARSKRTCARVLGNVEDPLKVYVDGDFDDQCAEPGQDFPMQVNETPWRLGDGEFPVGVGLVGTLQRCPGFLKKRYAQWQCRCGGLSKPDFSMPKKVQSSVPCLDLCGSCTAQWGLCRADLVKHILTILQALVAPIGVKDFKRCLLVSISVADQWHHSGLTVLSTSFRKGPEFAAEFIECCGPSDPCEPPYAVNVKWCKLLGMIPFPTMLTETDTAVRASSLIPAGEPPNICFTTIEYSFQQGGLVAKSYSKLDIKQELDFLGFEEGSSHGGAVGTVPDSNG